jgi:DNA-binding NarL/FixJ family response regulator
MHHTLIHPEGPSPSAAGKALQPVIITADQHFLQTIIAGIPEQQSYCRYMPALTPEHTLQLSHEFGDALLLFVDIDAYAATDVISFMEQRRQLPHPPQVIGISECRDLNVVMHYLKTGFNGYFLKQEVNAALLAHSANILLQRGFPLSPLVTQQLIYDLVVTRQNNYTALLSKRELDILNHLEKGSTYKRIAFELRISLETVRFHVKNIYRKLNVNSRSELVTRILHWPYTPGIPATP